jgi:hypothetical protein
MRNAIIVLVVLVIGYIGVQAVTMIRNNIELSERVEYRLDFVDEQSIEQVKKDIVEDARQRGVEVLTSDITILYEDTQQLTVPQKMVTGKVATFQNKRIVITVKYRPKVAGFIVPQEIVRSKIKQVAATNLSPSQRVPILPGLDD